MNPRLLLLVMLPLLAAGPALSNDAGRAPPFADPQMIDQLREAQDLARQAGERLLRSFEALERAIPRYGVPYIDADGNIVIPRRNRPRGTPVPEAPTERT